MFRGVRSLFNSFVGSGGASSPDRTPPFGIGGNGIESFTPPDGSPRGGPPRGGSDDESEAVKQGTTRARKSKRWVNTFEAANEEGLVAALAELERKECGHGQKFISAQAAYPRKKTGDVVRLLACRFSRPTHGSCPWSCRTVCAVGKTCYIQVAEGVAHNDHREYHGEQ